MLQWKCWPIPFSILPKEPKARHTIESQCEEYGGCLKMVAPFLVPKWMVYDGLCHGKIPIENRREIWGYRLGKLQLMMVDFLGDFLMENGEPRAKTKKCRAPQVTDYVCCSPTGESSKSILNSG